MTARTYRLINLLLLAAFYAGSAMVYPTLPERIPRHFDLAGRPDAWGDRSPAAWFALPVIATATALMLELATRFALRHPEFWNVPDKRRFLQLSPAERGPIIARLRDFMALTGVLTTALLAAVQAMVYQSATGRGGTPFAALAAALAIVAVLIASALRMGARIRTLIREAHARMAAS